MIVEATLGLLIPGGMKKLAIQFAEFPKDIFPGMGACLLAITALTWGLVLADLPPIYWVLLFIGVMFATMAALCFVPGGMRGFVKSFIGDRRPAVIRLIYAIEGAAAGLIVWLTVNPQP